MTNTNCLAGIRCPNCGSYEPFHIMVKHLTCMYDDGSDDTRGYDSEWDGESYIECAACHHSGKVKDFKDVDNAGRFKECKLCDNTRNIDNMRLHQNEWICEDCWDERLKATE